MMLNRNNLLADNLKLKVEYKGVSPQKQHLFSSGGPLISYVFNTLEEAVERFGDRINLQEKRNGLSFFFKAGLESTKYDPLPTAKGQNLVEYGLGRMKQLMSKKAATPAPTKPEPVVRYPKPAAPSATKPNPMASTPPAPMSSVPPPKRGPGRPPKSGLQLGELRQSVGK